MAVCGAGEAQAQVAGITDSKHDLPIVPNLLDETGIAASMNRRGACRDNACSEKLLGSLKVER
jgi:transposase InsO family protein